MKLNTGRSKPPTAGLSHGKWEIDPTELTLLEELGSGKPTVKEYVKFLRNFLTPPRVRFLFRKIYSFITYWLCVRLI